MAQQVWKFPLGHGKSVHRMPKNARILAVQHQPNLGDPVLDAVASPATLWALVDPSHDLESRQFWLVPTGSDLPEGCTVAGYLATVQNLEGALVWHVFEAYGYVPTGTPT